MADDAYATRALLELALAAYRKDLLGSLPASKRYLGAMVANALEIALRDLDDLVERSQTELLDALLPGGDIVSLAAAIRSGAVPADGQEAALRSALLRHLETELTVRNPRFLNDWKS